MVNSNKLKGIFKENGVTQEQVAKKLGISPRTLSLKLKNQVFSTTEATLLIKEFNIQEPEKIFFSDYVS